MKRKTTTNRAQISWLVFSEFCVPSSKNFYISGENSAFIFATSSVRKTN